MTHPPASDTRQQADGHHIAQASDGGVAVVGERNIVTVVNQLRESPYATLQAAAAATRRVLRAHWSVLLLMPLLILLLMGVFDALDDLYRVGSTLQKWGAVGLAAGALPAAHLLWRQGAGRDRRLVAATGLAGLLLLLDLGWQTRQVLWPDPFPAEKFGIAVARFGQDDLERSTPQSRKLGEYVYQGVKEDIQGRAGGEMIEVKPIGLVTSREEADAWGERLQADLVVWGQLFTVGDGRVWVHFEIIQTFDRVSSPAFPLLLPAQTEFSQTIGRDVKPAPDPDEIDRLVLQRSRLITAFSLGLAAYFNRDYQVAIRQFEEVESALGAGDCTSDRETRALLYFYLGRSYQRAGDLEGGEAVLEQAATCRPEDPAVRLSIAYGINSMGRREAAVAQAEEALDLADAWLRRHPGDIAIRYARGLAYQLLEQPRRAALEFDEIIQERDPNFYVAYISAGLSYLEAGDVPLAIERLGQAVELAEARGTDRSWGVLHLADAYAQAGDVARARPLYEEAAALAPGVDWMHYKLAQFYEAQGEPAAAEDALNRMVDAAYDKAWARSERAQFYRRQSRIQEALRELAYVCQRRRKDPLLHVTLAELYQQTGQEARARETYAQALALRETPHPYDHASYGIALVSWGEYAAAVEQFETALALDPDDDHVRFLLGRAYESAGQPEQAWETFQEILAAEREGVSGEVRGWAQERLDALRPQLARPTPASTSPPTPTGTPTPTGRPTPAP